jgi:membrane-associated phospholipid phosphatase
MTTSLAQIISFLFNPVLMLVFVPLLLVDKTTGDVIQALAWTGYTMIFLIAISFFVIYGVHKKIFTDLDVSKRGQRPLLFIVGICMTLFYLCGLTFLNAPKILIFVTIGFIAGVLLLSLINTRLKVSFHVTTVSALLFALAIIYQGFYYLVLLLIPLVAWARLKIKRHTLPETVVGAVFGVLLSLGMYLVIHHYYLY